MERVVAVLPHLEKRLPVPAGGPAPLVVRGRVATNPHRPDPSGPVPFERIVGEAASAEQVLPAVTSATSIRLSKFSSGAGIRARILYHGPDGFLSAKVAVGTRQGQAAVWSAVRARRAMGQDGGMPALPLITWGRRRRFAYLMEPFVFGHHPTSVEERIDVGCRLIDRLVAWYDSSPIEHVVPAAHPRTDLRLGELTQLLDWSPEWLPAGELLAIAAEVIPTTATMPTGWTHGDLVFSNIIATPTGSIVLVDWEHAARRPVASDLAKLAGSMAGHTGLAEVLSRAAASLEVPRGLTVRQQLMRCYLQELSWWEPKRRRAEDAGRDKGFDRWVRRRLDLLTHLAGG